MYQTLCAEFYDADKGFAEPDELNFYKKFIDKHKLILEPMCGSGRLLIPLIQEGYQIHGSDNSAPMLENCKERAKTLAEEKEEIHVNWYYPYEMELILEKYGFKKITHQEEFFRDENHLIWIAEA